MPDTTDHPPKRRRIGWWIFLGVITGAALTAALLLLPPVQAWLLRRILATQSDTSVDFSRIAVGPGGAEAANVRVRVPNLTVEARALRLAISPWQLLSRRRLAIADLQARQLDIRAASDPAPAATPTPFTGILAGIQAPLAWACANAEADGVITFEQPGAAPIRAAFEIKARNLDIDRPGQLEFSLAARDLVAGFAGEWRFAGTLDFVPAPGGGIERIVVNGRAVPATSADWWLPEVAIRLTASRTPDGEAYELSLNPGLTGHELHAEAKYTERDGLVAGSWRAHGGSVLAGLVLKRTDLPAIDTESTGTFTLNSRTGEADATVAGTFTGSEWERFMPELIQVGRAHGRHTAKLTRHASDWTLTHLEADARSEGSAATFALNLDRPLPLPPGARGDTAPWGRLRVEKLPLGWTAPVLGVARLKDGEAGGTWALSSPDPGILRFTPLTPFESSPFTVEDASLPKLPPLRLTGEAHLDLTPATATLRIEPAALVSEQGDRMEGVIESVADIDQYTATFVAHGTARLPTWLGGAQAPVLHGRLTADLREFDATVQSLRVTARDENGSDDTFVLEWLSPFRVDYERPEAPEFAEGDLARFSARDLRLDWAAPLLPGFSLAGRLAAGESTLRREGTGIVVATARPWELRDLALVQGGIPLLLASTFTLAPEGHVQLGADWVPGDFAGTVRLGGRLEEIFRLRDPAGSLATTGAATVTRTNGQIDLRSFGLSVQRADGSPLLDLETLLPLSLGSATRARRIDEAPDTLRLRTAAVPLSWLQPLLPEGTILVGTLDPAEFYTKAELPNLLLHPSRPLAFNIERYDDATGSYLRDARIEASPTIIVMGTIASLVVENGRVLVAGREAGTAGLAFMYFMSNLQIPISAALEVSANMALVRNQPFAATLPLPATGTAQLILEHDLMGDKDPTATFLLYDVQDPAAPGTVLPRFGTRVALLKSQGERHRARVDFQYQTAPAWSAFTTEFDYGMTRGRAEINTTIKGEFFDAAQFMRLVEACTPAVTPPESPTPGSAGPQPPAGDTPAPAGPAGPFWQSLLAKIDLAFGLVAYDAYRIEGLTGEFSVTEDAVDLRQLSGRMFDGGWRGNLRLTYDDTQPAHPYQLEGGFAIDGFSGEHIVQAAYPNEVGSFKGRLHFDSKLRARGDDVRQLFDSSTSEFTFRSEGGRLQLQVPHSNLASAALLVGGAITFSPELRAMGRLIKTFSDLPVDELSARGRREPDGALTLEDFRVQTPQLRLSARGTVAANPGVDLAARPFELPVTLAVRDEMAVIFKGMKLIGRKADADGYFTMNRQPVLRGTLGAPDTTDLYDVLAQAATGSSGTFGFLMRKVQQEAAKAQGGMKAP